MRRVFVIAPALYVTFSLGGFAQQPLNPPPPKPPPPSPCPKLEIQGQAAKSVRDGQPVSFGVNLSGGDPNVTPTIVWNISAGSIKEGQGTHRIDVDTTGAGADRQIVAELWVGGYGPECPSQASAAVKVIGFAQKVDEFGELDPEKENERLASIAANVSPTVDSIYIIAYAGRTNARGYASNALKRIRTQFGANGLAPQRVGALDGGFREEVAYEIWIVPEGAEQPRPTPTVDRKDIVFPSLTPVRTTPAKTPTKKP